MNIGDNVIVEDEDGELVRGTWLEQSSANVTFRTERGGTMNGPYVWVRKI